MSESGSQSQPDDATVDLLIKQVTEGLSPDEQRALDAMDGAAASVYLRDFERAAAAISLAGSANAAAPPASLKLLLQQQAQKFFETTAANPAAAAPASTVVDFGAARTVSARPRSSAGAYGWFAAAASLVLAVFGWMRSPPPVAPVADVVVPPAIVAPAVQPAVPPTAAEGRAALLTQPESLKITLAATKDPAGAGVTGDVVWDPASQRGYLRFVGLAPNDPRIHQYQLWIFDGGRDKRYPVDGGVFDIPANSSEVLIPIHAALAVLRPAAFAVTLEKPGGVVVSGREHVVVLGAAG